MALSSVPRLKHFNVSAMSSSGFSLLVILYVMLFSWTIYVHYTPYYLYLVRSGDSGGGGGIRELFLKTGTDLFYTCSLRVDFHCRVIFFVRTCVKFPFAK